MSSRNPTDWMWAQAVEFLDQAERMHRQFFRLAASERTRAVWQPPANVFEDEREIVIHYNETLVPLGWMPVTKVTDELRKCFEAHYDVETFCELIEQTADAPETWPKHRRSRTIFRVGWDNY